MPIYHFDLTDYDYQFLTDTWKGVKGAAYNVVYEDLRGAGLVDRAGNITEKGKQALREYMNVSDSDGEPLGL